MKIGRESDRPVGRGICKYMRIKEGAKSSRVGKEIETGGGGAQGVTCLQIGYGKRVCMLLIPWKRLLEVYPTPGVLQKEPGFA